MLYSKACEYGIRALTYLAQHNDGLTLAKEISENEEIPHYFLSKILQTLAKGGMLSSTKGPGGGFQLMVQPEKLTLYEIKEAIDGVADLQECAVGLARCNDQMPCPLHDTFKPIRQQIKTYLQETTLAEMAAAVEKKKQLVKGSPAS